MAGSRQHNRRRSAAAVIAIAIALSVLALYGVWAFWPSETPPGTEPPLTETVHVLGFEPTLSRDGLLFAIVVFAAVLGGLLHVLTSLAVAVRNGELRWGATPAYLAHLVLGVCVAGVLFVLIRFALAPSEAWSPYWLAALAASAGVVAEPAARRLREVLPLKIPSS